MSPAPAPLRTNIFHYRDFRFFWLARVMASNAWLIQGVTIGWQVYNLARAHYSIEQSAFLVGMAGLAQFVPMFALALIGGATADRYDRRKILLICFGVQILGTSGLAALACTPSPSVVLVLAFASLIGVTRSFMGAAGQAMMPMLIPHALLPRAVAWNTLSFQIGMVCGPWFAGLLCAHSVALAYSIATALFLGAFISFTRLRADTRPKHNNQSRAAMIREGLSYLWSNKIVLGAMTLDLFAVLLGGVTALLPVFAKDIFHIGPEGFGLLRTAPAIGSALSTLTLSIRPIQRHAGRWILLAVTVYGLATLAFSASTNLWLALPALAVMGMADSVSVFVRQSLIQIVTPDPLRGRVSAVASLFISASNELGEFESGVMARFLGPVGSAIFGGVGSIAITALWALLFPALRKADRMIEPEM